MDPASRCILAMSISLQASSTQTWHAIYRQQLLSKKRALYFYNDKVQTLGLRPTDTDEFQSCLSGRENACLCTAMHRTTVHMRIGHIQNCTLDDTTKQPLNANEHSMHATDMQIVFHMLPPSCSASHYVRACMAADAGVLRAFVCAAWRVGTHQ